MRKHGQKGETHEVKSSLEGFTSLFPGDPAVWAQTIILAITLIYVRGQLAELVEQNQAPRRAKVYEMNREYEKSVYPGIEKVRRLAWRSRMPEVSAAMFTEEMKGVDAGAAIKAYFAYTNDLDECVQMEVCDKKKASELLCVDMKHTYQALYHDIKDTRQKEWLQIPFYHYEPTMIGLIHNYCGTMDRVAYYVTF